MQSIRTALRIGGRFFYEGEGVERRDRAVEGAADVGGDKLEPDRAEEVAQHLRRASVPLFQYSLEVAHAILDPLNWRRAEDLLAAAAQCIDLLGKRVDSALGLDQGLGERLAAAAFADEVDEVGEPALLGGELSLLELEGVGQV